MKILRLTEFYGRYADEVVQKDPQFGSRSFSEQKKHLYSDAFSWFGSWDRALTRKKIEALEINIGFEPHDRRYAIESGLDATLGRRELMIAVAIDQVKKFSPDVLWFDCHRSDLLKAIRQSVPSIRIVLGWVGSAIPKTEVWQQMNMVLTCAPESLDYFKKINIPAMHLDHGFDPEVAIVSPFATKVRGACFVGQVIRGPQFHADREKTLVDIIKSGVPLTIFSPVGDTDLKRQLRQVAERVLFDSLELARNVGIPNSALLKLPVIGRAANWYTRPSEPVHPLLKKAAKPPVFGRKMLESLSDHWVSLNVHADSSPRFASNMRLFEATGMQSVLLTETRPNLRDLFEPDSEVVTYSSPQEGIEKIKWLLDHPKESEQIALAGQKRCLRDHTFDRRAEVLLEVILPKLLSTIGKHGDAPRL